MKQKKFTVWVLYNQSSNPYKLKQFQETLPPNLLSVELVNTQSIVLGFENSQAQVTLDGKLVPLPDFCISLIVDTQGNEYSFTILEYLEAFGVPQLNSLQSIALVSDKYSSSLLLKKNGFPTPPTELVKINKLENFLKDSEFDFPFVLKPVHGRKSRGVAIIRTKSELQEYLLKSREKELLVQNFISESFRKDLRVYVLGEQVIGAIKRTAHARTFSQVTAEKVSLSKELEERSLKIAKLFGLNFCCVDYFLDEQNSVCEVNSHPGFIKFETVFETSLVAKIYSHVVDRLR